MSNRMVGRALIIGVMALFVEASNGIAAAQGDFEVRGGYYADMEDGFVGGGWLGGIDSSSRWFVNPNMELVFVDQADYVTMNVDVHRDIPLNPRSDFWLGAGPALLYTDPDSGRDDTDVGLNLLAGWGVRSGRVRPFVQGKVIVADDSQAVLAVGVRF